MADQDIIAGVAYLNGIKGSITITPSGGTALTATTANIGSRDISHQFTVDEITSQGGDIIESAIASKEFYDSTIEFMPKAASKASAQTAATTLKTDLTPLKTVTVANSTVTAYNGTSNYIGGFKMTETRDGRVVVTFNTRAYKNSSGTFGALALAS
jgi:hypothetical protein